MTALILKPHLIPLIPAKFLVQSGKTELKVITCTECNSAYFRAIFKAQPQRPPSGGRTFQDGSGVLTEQVPDGSTTVAARFIYNLQSTGCLDPVRSFTAFGEIGLMIHLKGSV